MALQRTKQAPLLAIAMIDDECIDAVVAGDFDEGCPDNVLDRLDRLTRCGSQHLRIDLSRVVHLDERAARVFVDVAESACRSGGRIEFVSASAAVGDALETATRSRQDEPSGPGSVGS